MLHSSHMYTIITVCIGDTMALWLSDDSLWYYLRTLMSKMSYFYLPQMFDIFTVSISWLGVTWHCVSFGFFSLGLRCFSGFHCWNAAAAHIASPSRYYYDHRLPWRDPNEDVEDAYFASCCFQSGHRWVRYSSCCKCSAQFVDNCPEIRMHGATCVPGSWAATGETRRWAGFFGVFFFYFTWPTLAI